MCRGNSADHRLGLCPLQNASVCHPTVEMSALGHAMVAAFYNPLAWPRTEGVRVPINASHSSSWTVTGTPAGPSCSFFIQIVLHIFCTLQTRLAPPFHGLSWT